MAYRMRGTHQRTACLDIALGFGSPTLGLVAGHTGLAPVFLIAAGIVLCAAGIALCIGEPQRAKYRSSRCLRTMIGARARSATVGTTPACAQQ
jgi:hypothetical protein